MDIKYLPIAISLLVLDVSSFYIKKQVGNKDQHLRKSRNYKLLSENAKDTKHLASSFENSRENSVTNMDNKNLNASTRYVTRKRKTSRRRKVKPKKKNILNRTKARSNTTERINARSNRTDAHTTDKAPAEPILAAEEDPVDDSNPFFSEGLKLNRLDKDNSALLGIPNIEPEPIDSIIEGESKNGAISDFFHDTAKGDIRVEGDIVYSMHDYMEMYEALNSNRTKRAIIRNPSRRWPNNIIPVDADLSFSRRDINQIIAALAEWNRYTCIKFRDVTAQDRRNNAPRVRFVGSSSGCYSRIGRAGGQQNVALSDRCKTKRVILHEVGHVIGFYHEHTRPDRDDYVDIDFSNIRPELHFNFNRVPDALNLGVEYDYASMMHYSERAFATNMNRRTITIKRGKDQRYQRIMGRATQLSFRDVKQANLLLGCAAGCGQRTCPGEGFLDQECNCLCPSASEPAVRCGGSGSSLTVGISNLPRRNFIFGDNVRTLENFRGAIDQLNNANRSVPLEDRVFFR